MKISNLGASTSVNLRIDLTLEPCEVDYLQYALDTMMISDFEDSDKYIAAQKIFYVRLLEALAQVAVTAR